MHLNSSQDFEKLKKVAGIQTSQSVSQFPFRLKSLLLLFKFPCTCLPQLNQHNPEASTQSSTTPEFETPNFQMSLNEHENSSALSRNKFFAGLNLNFPFN